MALSTNITPSDFLHFLGLLIAIIVIWVNLRRMNFVYYKATLLVEESDAGGIIKTYTRVVKGKVVRKNKKTGLWEVKDLNKGRVAWIPLEEEKAKKIAGLVSEGKSIDVLIE
ncbi:MAG: hypothetical protein QG654_55 [Patescibacteria group bacterium]|nr:hypothetical protein [Patescibacteria group bacterium]